MAQVEQIFIAREKRSPVIELTEAFLETGLGIKGDRYYSASEAALGRGEASDINQVTLIDKAALDEFLSAQDSDLGYGEFRRSIITSGIDLNALIGKAFYLGDVKLHGTELCEPCAWLSANVHAAVLPGLVHKAGIRAVVHSSGTIKPGTEIRAAE